MGRKMVAALAAATVLATAVVGAAEAYASPATPQGQSCSALAHGTTNGHRTIHQEATLLGGNVNFLVYGTNACTTGSVKFAVYVNNGRWTAKMPRGLHVYMAQSFGAITGGPAVTQAVTTAYTEPQTGPVPIYAHVCNTASPSWCWYASGKSGSTALVVVQKHSTSSKEKFGWLADGVCKHAGKSSSYVQAKGRKGDTQNCPFNYIPYDKAYVGDQIIHFQTPNGARCLTFGDFALDNGIDMFQTKGCHGRGPEMVKVSLPGSKIGLISVWVTDANLSNGVYFVTTCSGASCAGADVAALPTTSLNGTNLWRETR